jgi:hypothetical protein
MRCVCCDRVLNDYESTLKSSNTLEYLDTCMKCLDGLDIDTIGRDDLSKYEEVDDLEFDGEEDDSDSY